MKKRQKRAGRTEVFSVSVDTETKRLLRKYAAQEFGGNVSQLIAELVHQAAARASRQKAADQFLEMQGYKPMTPQELERFEAEIQEELARQTSAPRRRRRRVA